jgi:O-acetyl-ADP-ribose deacetylase (regulator of RNase III)
MRMNARKPNQAEARWIHGAYVECVLGDIAAQPGLHAIVCSASGDLGARGPVAGAVHRRAGSELAGECARYIPELPGSAVITRAYGLPNRYVIHCRGPRYGDHHDAEVLLAACYRQAVELAQKHEAVSLGLPAISTGSGGFPMAKAARIALETIVATLPRCRSVRRVRMVLRDSGSLAVHTRILDEVAARARED